MNVLEEEHSTEAWEQLVQSPGAQRRLTRLSGLQLAALCGYIAGVERAVGRCQAIAKVQASSEGAGLH